VHTLEPEIVDVVISCVDEAEVDAMWSFVGKKKDQGWLWHAIDHRTGKVLAYVFGRRKDDVFCSCKRCWSRLASRAITRIIGAHTSGTSPRKSTAPASGIRSKTSGSI
jgi:hypothetical protein